MKPINIFVINIPLVCQNCQVAIIKLTYDRNLPLNDEDTKNLKLFDIILQSNMSTSTYNLLKKHFMPELLVLSIFILQARISKLSHVTVSYDCCLNMCCCFTGTYVALNSCPSVNMLGIIQKATHTKNTNIYLLNLASNHST